MDIDIDAACLMDVHTVAEKKKEYTEIEVLLSQLAHPEDYTTRSCV